MTKYDISQLSLDEKIGQLIVFGFDALSLNEHAIRMIKDYKAGNVILFARNVKTPKQVFELTKNLQRLAMETIGIPLLISIDQEGGMVTRIKQHATFFPGAMTLAASGDPKHSYESGRLMGLELKSLGINMDLAPSLDINNNPHNPVIGVRSFGDTPEIVTSYGLANIKGLQEHVIATAKHFPGHGDTAVDSHLDLPKIDKSLKQIEAFELIPFKAAIDAGVKAIMTSHINFPAVNENGLPSTLSKQCLTGLLREKLGFKGLIVTDCMQMKAIQTYYTTPIGCLMALNAGADMVMVSHDEHLQVAAIEKIKHALKNQDISMDTIDRHVERILDLKERSIELDFSTDYQEVAAVIEDDEAKNFSLNVVKKALTKVRGSDVDVKKKTLVIASDPISTTIADEDHGKTSIIKAVNQELPEMDTMSVSIRLDEESLDDIVAKAKVYDQVVFASYNANIYQKQLALIKRLDDLTDLHVIAMRNPYDSVFLPSIKNLVLMYEYTPNAVKVLLMYLKGEIKAKGLCPVTL